MTAAQTSAALAVATVAAALALSASTIHRNTNNSRVAPTWATTPALKTTMAKPKHPT
jgi:hypothetical protein